MAHLNLLLAILKPLGAAADRCQHLRQDLERLGPVDHEPPSGGAILVSVIGILTIPAAILADYHLLSAPIDYICQLSGVAATASARMLVPISLAVVNVAASISRAQQAVLEDTYSEYEPQTPPLHPIITIVLLLQVAAAGAQYIALQAVNPAPANALILLMLGALAVVSHTAVYLLAGNGILLLAKASRQTLRTTRHRRLTNALRLQRRALFRHFQAWKAASIEYQQANQGASAPELDPVIVNELNAAIGAPLSLPTAIQAPTTPHAPTADPTTAPPPASSPASEPSQPPSGLPDPPNPYTPSDSGWGDDQRL